MVDILSAWVSDGGVLAIFGNSKGRCDFTGLNLLAGKFGITFKGDESSATPKSGGTWVTDGVEHKLGPESITYRDERPVPPLHGGFPDRPLCQNLYAINIASYGTLATEAPAEAVLEAVRASPVLPEPRPWYVVLGLVKWPGWGRVHFSVGGRETIVAECQYGRGLAIAVGGPWFENDNVMLDETKSAGGNRLAAENFAGWLLASSFRPLAEQSAKDANAMPQNNR
jgi:hypothetical protein